jgi:hypothetical protein
VAILRGRLARIIPRSALIDSRTEVREIERHRNELGETSYGGLDRQQRRDRHVCTDCRRSGSTTRSSSCATALG